MKQYLEAMEEAESEKRRMVPRSSIQRKPFSNLTNLLPEPHRHSLSFSQSKKLISSAAVADLYMSDSSTVSTQNRNRGQHLSTVSTDRHSLPTPQTPNDWVGDGNHIACTRRQTMLKTRSKTKPAAVPVYPILVEKTKNDTKKLTNIMKDVHIPLSGVKIHDNRKPIVPIISPMPHSTGKMNEKGKEICVPPRYPPMENTNIMKSPSGVKLKDIKKVVGVGSSLVDLSKKYNDEEVVTPISFDTLEKDKGSNCWLLAGTKRNRKVVEGAEDALQTKSSTNPLPNNKKRKYSSKGSSKKFVMPQDFIDQQKAYFEEIDEYELEVEEVE